MFKRALRTLSVVCLLTSVGTAQSPFIGTWKLDPAKSRLPDAMKVQSKGGKAYVFDFGGGAETIVVDGRYQPGLGGTLLSVSADAPDTWTVKRQKDNRLTLTATWKLSNNDSTLTDQYRQFEPDGSTLSMDYVYRRVGRGRGGGTGFAADWQSIKETVKSPFLMEVKQFQGDGFSFVSPFGTTNAKFDDGKHANQGPDTTRGASTSVRRLDVHTLVITRKQDGKVTATEEVALSTDLKGLTMTVHVAGSDRPNVLVFERD